MDLKKYNFAYLSREDSSSIKIPEFDTKLSIILTGEGVSFEVLISSSAAGSTISTMMATYQTESSSRYKF
jgi:hypothetical protein